MNADTFSGEREAYIIIINSIHPTKDDDVILYKSLSKETMWTLIHILKVSPLL